MIWFVFLNRTCILGCCLTSFVDRVCILTVGSSMAGYFIIASFLARYCSSVSSSSLVWCGRFVLLVTPLRIGHLFQLVAFVHLRGSSRLICPSGLLPNAQIVGSCILCPRDVRYDKIELNHIITCILQGWEYYFCLKNGVTALLSVRIMTGFGAPQKICPISLNAK